MFSFGPENISFFMDILGFGAIITVFILVAILVMKMERIKALRVSLGRYKKSFEELDEQAKIIVKTDLALNKTQEELDKKLSGLYVLQKLSRQMSTTMEEEKIFSSIEEYIIQELGFNKCLVFVALSLKVCLGYNEAKAEELLKNNNILAMLNQENAISSVRIYEDSEAQTVFALKESMLVRDFVIAPIFMKGKATGLLFMGSDNPTIALTEGDEELVTILATQLGQALDNAHSFEEIWRSQHELEEKIQNRTKELSGALAQIEAINKRKTEFLSAVAHELRTPLTSIKGYASLLTTGQLGEIPAAARERLEKINRHSDELTHFINDLLDISRIESGRAVMKLEPQDLKAIVEAVDDMFSPVLKEKNINLEAGFAPDLKNVLADASQVKRVFINIIGNAVKFTPAGGKIIVKVSDAGSSLKIDISDTGIGIAQRDLDKIFDEFYRADNPINQNIKGTGLGLSLVKSIIHAHGGTIEAKSDLNKGTTFSFTLPKVR